MKKRNLELALENADLTTNGGLSNAKVIGCGCNAFMPSNGMEYS